MPDDLEMFWVLKDRLRRRGVLSSEDARRMTTLGHAWIVLYIKLDAVACAQDVRRWLQRLRNSKRNRQKAKPHVTSAERRSRIAAEVMQ